MKVMRAILSGMAAGTFIGTGYFWIQIFFNLGVKVGAGPWFFVMVSIWGILLMFVGLCIFAYHTPTPKKVIKLKKGI